MIASYISVFLSVLAIGLAMASQRAMHGLLYLLLGLIALAFNLSLQGNGLGAVLLMIVYAGAIMVLFIFVVMLLNRAPSQMQVTLKTFLKQFFGPVLVAASIFFFLIFVQVWERPLTQATEFPVTAISRALFLDGWFFVELISLLLTAALVGAFHIGKRRES